MQGIAAAVVIVGLAFGLCGGVEGAEWVQYSKKSSGVFFYDKESIFRSSPDSVQVWERLIFDEEVRQKIFAELTGANGDALH